MTSSDLDQKKSSTPDEPPGDALGQGSPIYEELVTERGDPAAGHDHEDQSH
ncbi:hypothetical protein [Actinotalea sp. K2]|uniref:hypothetical protein n=1 Tax=Actinotalea sp. K2 TaxID=2939438 RepID=UPI002016CCA5|nr:hypothetical protein [Actinotalea sp. K2]MCL3862447.1 hypothetical protein [Actinotalea sp. K2]